MFCFVEICQRFIGKGTFIQYRIFVFHVEANAGD